MKFALQIAVLLALTSLPAAAGVEDAQAHTKLTDGVRATTDQADEAWLRIYSDSTQLPVTAFGLDEFCFWGVNAPQGVSPKRSPALYSLLKDANIRGVRYDLPWYGLQQEPQIDFNWYSAEDDISAYVRDGHTVMGVLSYTPAWANGMQGRAIPPSQPVQNEAIDLSSGSAVLQHYPLVNVLVTRDPVPTTRHTEEVLTTNFAAGDQPRCSHNPVIVGTEQVWVDEGDGYKLWTRVDNLVHSPEGAEHYEFDRAGRVKFRFNGLYWHHGKTPKAGSKVKVSYDSIDFAYVVNTDYTVDVINGVIRRKGGNIYGSIPAELFDSTTIDARWEWMNAPAAWNSNQTTAGHLTVVSTADVSGPGHFLYQSFTGDGDFTVTMRLASLSARQAGIMVYQDANNWFRYCLTTDQSRPYLVRCVDGVVTTLGSNGELGWMCTPPRWITLRKSGNTYTGFTSSANPEAPDGGYQWTYTFSQALTFPLKVGISCAGGGSADIDEFRVALPRISSAQTVRVFYDYLDTKSWFDFVKAVVGHYKDRVKYWELWNEPDQWWCWTGGPALHAIMVREGAKAVREADPTAYVISGGWANGANKYLDNVYATIGKADQSGNDWFDYAAWHPYLFTNTSPDKTKWAINPHYDGRQAMAKYGDSAKQVFFGEISSSSGVLCSGGGNNERRQTDFALRLSMMARKLEFAAGMQWWPAQDISAVGEAEDYETGGHDGLFYKDGTPKPAYYAYKAAATNKGFLIDLATYDSQDNLIPESGSYSVKTIVVGAQDRSRVASIRVLTSLTATDDSSRPSKVAARHIGQAGTPPFVVDVATISASLKTEKWTLTAVSPTSFTVSASRSGGQGTATVGTPFNANNGAVSFTIPAGTNPYIAGDRFEFETFVGDGWSEAIAWVNPGLSGAGDIVISLPAAVQARYVSLHFVKAAGASEFTLDEVAVQDDSGANVSQGKLYLMGGYHQTVVEPDDTVPPQSAASLSPDPGTGWASQAVTVTLSSTDNDGGSGVRDLFYSLDGFATSLPYTQPFTLGEGTRTVQFYAVDNEGNAEAVRSLTVRVDLTPPTGTLVINGGAQYATSSTVSLTLTGSDALSGVAQMRLSLNGVSWTAPEAFATARSFALAEGEGFRTAYVQFQDAAGNWSTGPISDGIIVDKTAPTAPTGVTATSTNPGSVSLSWTASTDTVGVSQYSVYRDGQLLGGVSATGYTDSAATAGQTYTYTVRASDAAGHVSAASSPASVTVAGGDTTPPTTVASLSPDPGQGWANQAVTVALTSTDNQGGSGVESITYTLNGWTTTQTYAQPFSVGEGTHTLQYRARDRQGNTEVARTATVKVDLTRPTGTVQINGGAAYSSSSTVSLTLGASDAHSGVAHMSFSSNGVSWSAAEPYGTTKSWTLADGEGFRTAYVKYQDAAGNWTNEPISRGIVVDKTAPSRPTGVAASPSGNNRVNVSWTASTDATGVTGYTLYRDGQLLGTVTITGYTDQSVLPGHTYSYTVTARDAVGNVSPPSDLVTAAVPWGDSVPPTTTLALSPDPGAGWANQSVTVVLSSSDGTDGSGVRQISYSLDGWSTSNTYTQPFSVGEGVTTVSYRAEDNAGNLETSNTSPAIRVDLQPPSGTVAINGGATLTNSFGVSLSLSAEDTGSGVTHMRFSSDGSSWTTAESFAGSRSWTLPAGDGSHSVHLQLRDAAGNWSAGSISSAIVVDATPPTTPTGVTATSPDGVSVSVGWQASSDATGVTGYRVYRGGALLGESTSTGYTDNDVSSGNSYSYTVRSVDSAGNLSLPSVSAAIALATDAPVLDLAMTGNLVDPLPGETVRLQVTYRNNSATDAVDVTISCPLPDATTYVDGSATAGGVFDAGSGVVRWALSSVPVGATGHFYFEVTVD